MLELETPEQAAAPLATPARAPEPEPEPLIIESTTPPPTPEPEPLVFESPIPMAAPEPERPVAAPPPPPPPPPPPRPRADAPPAAEPARAVAGEPSALLVGEPTWPPRQRKFPVALAGGVAVVVIAAAAVGVVLMRGKGPEPVPQTPPPAAPAPPPTVAAPPVDSAALRAADSARAVEATMGWVRLAGDLPEDAIFWLGEEQMSGRLFQVPAGTYNLEVETSEFRPWERRITVRAGDTLRVYVELELLPQDSTQTFR